MKPRPVRMPEQLWEDLQAEAEDQGLGTAEYVRKILRQRADTQANTEPDTQPDTQALAGRVDELEERLADLEGGGASDNSRVSSETPQASTEDTGDTEGDTSRSDTDHTGAASAGSVTALQDLDLPGSGEVLEGRRATVDEMYSLLQERAGEVVKTGELKDLVDPDRVGYASVDDFWKSAVMADAGRDRPNALKELPGVSELGNGRYQYQE